MLPVCTSFFRPARLEVNGKNYDTIRKDRDVHIDLVLARLMQGFNTPAADPSARYLLRHPPGSSSGLGTAGPSGARQGQDGSGDAGSRSKSRFQFAREDDSTCGTADPLWYVAASLPKVSCCVP